MSIELYPSLTDENVELFFNISEDFRLLQIGVGIGPLYFDCQRVLIHPPRRYQNSLTFSVAEKISTAVWNGIGGSDQNGIDLLYEKYKIELPLTESWKRVMKEIDVFIVMRS